MNAPSFRLEKGDVIVIDSDWMQVIHRDRESLTLKPNGASHVGTRTYSNEELLKLYFDKRLKIVRQMHAALPPGLAKAIERAPDSFDERWQKEMLRRLDYVQACDRFFTRLRGNPAFSKRPETGFARIARIVARCRAGQSARLSGKRRSEMETEEVSGSALRDWYRRWEISHREMNALVPLHHRKGHDESGGTKAQLGASIVSLIAHHVRQRWLTLERPSVSIVHDLICRDVERLRAAGKLGASDHNPSKMAVHRWIKANVGDYERVFYREGRKAADSKVKASRPNPAVGIPLRVVEVDHTRLDLILIDDFGAPLGKKQTDREASVVPRPWLTTIIDVETRMIVGFYLDHVNPSWTSVMNALRMGVLEKDVTDTGAMTPWPVMGVPEILKLDNGKEFHSSSLKSAAGLLKIELRYCRRGTPHLKGRIERFFGEIARDYCAMFPGRTFANVVEKADYRPEEHARMTLAQAQKLLKIWICDIYHNRPHGGLFGKTPLQRWNELSGYGVRFPPKAEDLDALLGLVIDGQIHRDGVHYLGLRYSSDEVDELRLRPGRRGDQRAIKIDPQDLGSVFVLDPDTGKWLVALCNKPELVDGLDIRAWRETCERGRQMTQVSKRVTYTTLLEARSQIAAEAFKAGNKPRGKMSAHDLAWIRIHYNDAIFDIGNLKTNEPPTTRQTARKKRDSTTGDGPSPNLDFRPVSEAGGMDLPDQDILVTGLARLVPGRAAIIWTTRRMTTQARPGAWMLRPIPEMTSRDQVRVHGGIGRETATLVMFHQTHSPRRPPPLPQTTPVQCARPRSTNPISRVQPPPTPARTRLRSAPP